MNRVIRVRAAYLTALAAFIGVLPAMPIAASLGAEIQYIVTKLDTFADGLGSWAYDINDLGQIVGSAATNNAPVDWWDQYDRRPVLWNTGTTTPTELNRLTTGVNQYSGWNRASSINNAGTIVGVVNKAGRLGGYAVRWDAGSRTPTELNNLGPDPTGFMSADGAINNAGTIAGFSSNPNIVRNPVRWDASSVIATQLGNLSTLSDAELHRANSRPDSTPTRSANGINDEGTIVGQSDKYDAAKNYLGIRAVRWDAGTTTAVELGNLGVNHLRQATSAANGINNDGTIIGFSEKYDVAGNDLGKRAVRWDAGSTTAAQLDRLADPEPNSWAGDINGAGTIVGWAGQQDATTHRAIRWDASGQAHDLNNEIGTAVDGWTLTDATAINNRGQIVGNGIYNGQERAFLLTPFTTPQKQLPIAPIPTETIKLTGPYINNALRWPRTHGYKVGFNGKDVVVTLDVGLYGDDPVGPEGQDLMAMWKKGIENAWSNQYEILDTATGGKADVVFNVNLTNLHDVIPSWQVARLLHPTINLLVEVSKGSGRDNALHFVTDEPKGYVHQGYSFSEYQQMAAAHEAGHWLGLQDEYLQFDLAKSKNGTYYVIDDHPFLYDSPTDTVPSDLFLQYLKTDPFYNPKEDYDSSTQEYRLSKTEYDQIMAILDSGGLMGNLGGMRPRYFQGILNWLQNQSDLSDILVLGQAPGFIDRTPIENFGESPIGSLSSVPTPSAVMAGLCMLSLLTLRRKRRRNRMAE